VISLTKKGIGFLQTSTALSLNKPRIDAYEDKKQLKKGGLDFNTELFEILRSLRKDMALKLNVPPFVIFGDASLQEMSFYLPPDKNSFSKISGVGEKKLKQFGEIFLASINKFAALNKLTPIEKNENLPEPAIIKIKMQRPVYYLKTRELLIKKTPLERIAKHQDVAPGTIINHIEKLIDAGEKLDLEFLKLPRDRYEIMKEAFSACGDEKLKPVHEYLQGKFSYDELKLARILLRN
jgi:ATP-dependent DNA helicase RecQ